MSSSRMKKIHYEQGTNGTKGHHNRSRDSGVGSSSASDRGASLGTAPDSSFPDEDQRHASRALLEALDAANERIRQLEAANAKLNQALMESNKEIRLMKREKADLHNKLDDAMDDLEDERRNNRRARAGSSDGSSERLPLAGLPRSSRLDGRRPSMMSAPRDEKVSSAKSIDLVVVSQPTRFFQIGRVFKTLWTEPAGETATDTDKEYYRPVGYGQLSFTKMRRFVVVRKRLHSCLCLAISTYGGQGAAKKDSRSEDHAVVFSSKDPPPPDEQFTKEPIPIMIEEASETIDPKSVIDFGRVYTVEHNVKVLNVGRLAKSDKKRLDQYFADTIGVSADLEDESYGGDVPTPRPDSRATRRPLSRRSSFVTDITPSSRMVPMPPNPMANTFMPAGHPPQPMSLYAQGPITYAPSPIAYGHFTPPRPPEGPQKFAPNDGHYYAYPL